MPVPFIVGAVGLLGTIVTVIQVLFTVVSAIALILQVVAGVDTTLSFITDVKGPAATILDTMYSYLISFLPISINGIFTTLDSALSITDSSNNPFSPALTFTGLASTLAFTQTFNSVMMCFLNSLAFVLNVRFFRWSINRLKLRFR